MTDKEIALEIEGGLPELERQCRKLSALRHKMAMELSDFVDRKDCVINSQKVEIEKLNTELKVMRGAANSYKLELERKEDELRHAKVEISKHFDYMDSAANEAIKEFAERLKRKYKKLNGVYIDRLISETIDTLVKEMTEVQE